MNTFTPDQKVALLVVPVLLFSMLGTSYASTLRRDLTEEEEGAFRRSSAFREDGEIQGTRAGTTTEKGEGVATKSSARDALHEALINDDFRAFTEALRGTVFEESATREVFSMLRNMRELHDKGAHNSAAQRLHDALG